MNILAETNEVSNCTIKTERAGKKAERQGKRRGQATSQRKQHRSSDRITTRRPNSPSPRTLRFNLQPCLRTPSLLLWHHSSFHKVTATRGHTYRPFNSSTPKLKTLTLPTTHGTVSHLPEHTAPMQVCTWPLLHVCSGCR